MWKLPVKEKRYYIGVDTGEGLGGENDYSVISIVDDDLFQCLEWRSNRVKPWEFSELVHQIAMWYSKGLLIIEKASAGNTVVDRMKNSCCICNSSKLFPTSPLRFGEAGTEQKPQNSSVFAPLT